VTEALAWVRNRRSLLALGVLLGWILLDSARVEMVLRFMFPAETVVLYGRQSLAELFVEHVAITAGASAAALVIGGVLGLLLTFVNERFGQLIDNLTSLGQALPSVAVIALMVPLIGYGWETVVFALAIYGVLPVMVAVASGIRSVSPSAVDAALGMGMGRAHRLLYVQVPLAAPIIIGGIKNMVIINVSAATLGAIVGAGGFGVSIFAGIAQFNYALVVAGAFPTILLALIVDRALG